MSTSNNNFIHPTAIVGPNVQLGQGNYIGPYCIIDNCTVGSNNRFEAFCSIGTPAEHTAHFGRQHAIEHPVVIGSNNTFREFTTINCGTQNKTAIGNGVILLAKAHVGHDAIINDNVTLSCFACVGGHARVHEYANLGLHAVVHQFVTVPPGVMLGMGTVVPKKNTLEPFCTYVGNPARLLGPNMHLLAKLGHETEDSLKQKYYGC